MRPASAEDRHAYAVPLARSLRQAPGQIAEQGETHGQILPEIGQQKEKRKIGVKTLTIFLFGGENPVQGSRPLSTRTERCADHL
jgi:hypothetical protein